MSTFKKIHCIEDERLLLKNDSKCVVARAAKLSNFNAFEDLLCELLFCHNLKLFGFGNTILNFLNFLEHLIFVSGYLVPVALETVTNTKDFAIKDISRLYYNEESSHRLLLFFFITFSFLLFFRFEILRNIEGIQDGVTFGDSEDHFGESCKVTYSQYSSNILKMHLLERILFQINASVCFLAVEYLSSLEK